MSSQRDGHRGGPYQARGKGRGVVTHQNQVRAGTGRVRPGEDSTWRQRDVRNQQSDAPGNTESGARRHGTSQRKELFPISKSKLNDLLKSSPEDLIMELELNPGWGCLLEQKTLSDVEELVVSVKVFDKCLKGQNQNVILGFLRKYFEKFHNYFLATLAFLLDNLNERLANLVRDALRLYQNACAIAPRGTFQVAQVLVNIVKPHAGILQRKMTDGSCDLLELIEALVQQINSARDVQLESQQTARAIKRPRVNHSEDEPPPNDYKDIDIYPSIEDIEDLRPYIRKNIIDGPYENGFHYVDIQFRLLREDFVSTLREGVQNYLSLESSRRKKELKGNSVRYYFNVSCRGRVAALTDSVFYFALQLAPRDYQSVNWERSKRFVNGTVIGLSSDDFASMVFAFVTQRNINTLKKGGLSVECCRTEDEGYLEAGKNFSVIESTALFEAYRYNLKVLQNINPLLVPMEKYIVRLEKTIVPPQFITRGTCVNLSPIMSDSRNTDTEVLNSLNWPRLKNTKLDDAQYAAVQSAFARELCLIQGPPGTGKTYVGLLIVETFLLNRITTKPILVVCYTNHALDQFLEGIRSFSSKIVRVGGMCKDEDMMQFSLSELRLKRRDDAVAQKQLSDRYARQYRYRINQLRKEINSLQEESNKAFGKLVPDEALSYISGDAFHNKKEVIKWLQIERLAKLYEQREARETKPAKPISQAKKPDRLEEMAEEIQSDEEDMLVDEKDTDTDTLDVVDRLLSFHGRQNTTAFDLFIEHELTMSDRPKVSREAAGKLQDKLDKKGLNALSIDERWDLYRAWHDVYMKELDKQTEKFRAEYSESMRALKELEADLDLQILRGAQVIGMTTTGAAKYKHLYEKLDIEVVIVEEAAELLEAHIVTSISASTKQLILIGDHKQLRPANTSYKLAKDYHLDVSLFERLVNNGIPYVQLQLQHRMRPEFVRLLVPHIYPTLECEKSVYAYPKVRGMSQDLQLMSHTQLESHDGENRSKTNTFECEMVIGLVRYLVVHGYTYDQITVLAMYSGQQFLIKQKMRELNYSIRVTSVDNYQGEENDILVISFVRSNEDGIIGFLRTMNRLCVAFSRARHGLFCIGNFEMIAERLPAFRKILQSVADSVLDHFKLECKAHKNETRIRKPSDFFKVAEGGCNAPCKDRLDCGHMCPKQCHVYSNEELRFKCIRPCLKKLERCGHACRNLCGENCGPCREIISTPLPSCRHILERPCGSDEKLACKKLCEKRLGCGHMCDKKCSQPCQQSCRRKMKVQSICGHLVEVYCYLQNETYEIPRYCKEPCGEPLSCGHICTGSCASCYQGRFHVLCQSQCGKTLICGHVCRDPCAQVCPPCLQKCENSCVHSRCDRACGEPCVPCVEQCAVRCTHQKCAKLCSDECSTKPCTEPCPKKLKCGHECIGFCTDKCPNKCRVCDEEVCDVVFGLEEEDSRYVMLDCGHVIESTGMQKWVETCVENHEVRSGGISCPSCSSVVKETNRYMPYINANRRMIEAIKIKVFGTPADNLSEAARLVREVDRMIRDVLCDSFVQPLLLSLQAMLASIRRPDKMTIDRWSNVITVIKKVVQTEQVFKQSKSELIPGADSLWGQFQEALQRALDERVGVQQFEDMINEIQRFDTIGKLVKVLRKYPHDNDLKPHISNVSQLERYSEEKSKAVCDALKIFLEKKGEAVLGVTTAEKQMIIKAMGLSQGHWFQCPNGHVYSIGDCGGAMVEAKCSECDATIGGGSHRLRDDNRVASAMDGSRVGAWTLAQDMRNFDFDAIQ